MLWSWNRRSVLPESEVAGSIWVTDTRDSQAGGLRIGPSEGPPWLAAYTRHRHEEKFKRYCEERGFEVFLPCYQSWRRWSDRRKLVTLPLFPAYVFVRVEEWERLRVLSAPGFLWFVHNSNGAVRVAEGELMAVRRLLSSGLEFDPIPSARLGDEVEIVSGALRGTRGRLMRKDGTSVGLVVSAIQGVVRVNLPDPSWIAPIWPRPPGLHAGAPGLASPSSGPLGMLSGA